LYILRLLPHAVCHDLRAQPVAVSFAQFRHVFNIHELNVETRHARAAEQQSLRLGLAKARFQYLRNRTTGFIHFHHPCSPWYFLVFPSAILG